MKKILALFFLILVCFPLSSYIYYTHITLRSSVAGISLNDALISETGYAELYELYGGLESRDINGTEHLIIENISEEDITVYFRIAQTAKTRTNESIMLLIEAESLKNINSKTILAQNPDFVVETKRPTIFDINCLSSDALRINYVTDNCNKIQFMLQYRFGKTVEGTNLIFFTGIWNKEEDLAPGIYTSKIVLSYIIN